MKNKTFGEKIFTFYSRLKTPDFPTANVNVLLPFNNDEVKHTNHIFYRKYYQNQKSRHFIIGINPGRFGAGVTGIPFTDPVNLENILSIKNGYPKNHELSSVFVYEVIKTLGGPDYFFSRFYLTAVSPVGFTREGKNINYYDEKLIYVGWKDFFIQSLKTQMEAGVFTNKVFILGEGKNVKYFRQLTEVSGLFGEIIALPHPRWVMQYRYRDRFLFIRKFSDALSEPGL